MARLLPEATFAFLVLAVVAGALPPPAEADTAPSPQAFFSSYFGGNQSEMVSDLAVDEAGDIYFVGYTTSSDLPVGPNGTSMNFTGSQDAFLFKYNFTAKRLDFGTYIGGGASGLVAGTEVALGRSAVWVSTWTSSEFMATTEGVFDYLYDGGRDGWLGKFDTETGAILAASYIGGSGDDYVEDIAVNANGSLVVSGRTNSSLFFLGPGSYDPTHNGPWAGFDSYDGFAAVVDENLTAVLHSTLLGGGGTEQSVHVAIGAQGDIYVSGSTSSADFPTTAGANVSTPNGLGDIFLARFSPELDLLRASSYFGGPLVDAAYGVSVDGQGNFLVDGYTESALMATVAAFDQTLDGSRDAFVLKMDSNCSKVGYFTYVGGSTNDTGTSIAVDSVGRAYVTGWTDSVDFPLVGAIDNTSGTGGPTFPDREAFVTILSADGSQSILSTYLGGNRTDWGSVVFADKSGRVYVGGYTYSADFPVSGDAPDSDLSGPQDGFFARIPLNSPPTASFEVRPSSGTIDTIFEFNATASSDIEDNRTGLQVRWDFDGDGAWDTGFGNSFETTNVYARPGTYVVHLQVIDTFGLVGETTRSVVVDNTAPWAGFNLTPFTGLVTTDFTVNASPTFDLESPLSDLEFRWDFDNDSSWDTGWSSNVTAQARFARPGNWTVILQVRDPWGGTDQTTRMAKVLDSPPTAAFSLSRLLGTVADTFTVDASNSSDLEAFLGALDFRWDWDGDGVPDTEWTAVPTAEHRYAKPGNYTIRLETLDAGGNTNVTSATVIVIDTAPNARLSLEPANGNFTVKFRFNASASSDLETADASLEVRWDFDDDGSFETPWSTAKATLHSYPAPGTYVVKLQVRDEEGLVSEASGLVSVIDEVPVPRLVVRYGTTTCRANCTVDGPFVVDASGSTDLEEPASALEVRWDFDGDGQWDTDWSHNLSAEHRYAGPGTYHLRAQVRDGHGASPIVEMTVTVPKAPEQPRESAGFETTLMVATIAILVTLAVVVAILATKRKTPRR